MGTSDKRFERMTLLLNVRGLVEDAIASLVRSRLAAERMGHVAVADAMGKPVVALEVLGELIRQEMAQ